MLCHVIAHVVEELAVLSIIVQASIRFHAVFFLPLNEIKTQSFYSENIIFYMTSDKLLGIVGYKTFLEP